LRRSSAATDRPFFQEHSTFSQLRKRGSGDFYGRLGTVSFGPRDVFLKIRKVRRVFVAPRTGAWVDIEHVVRRFHSGLLTSRLRLDALPELVENDAVEEGECFDYLAVAHVEEPGIRVSVGLTVARRTVGIEKKMTVSPSA
jgi:hypothetical protein